ncbi:hypothetical protein V5E97_18610 [Singulisphaera sp. Ch08]|uniref:Carboxypeptidase regulatory-like domain-containing protein n=1 Tax=Singulisphaera sp. Ch08 TaxID=3120278 RepID=A0AAU7CTG2_9BACT
MRWHAGYLSSTITTLILLLSGCGEELGPEQFETTQVSGIIRLGGRSIDQDWKGWIEFIPVDGTVGKLRSATIRPDGSFEADRVAVGWNQIGLVNAPLGPDLASKFHPFSSPIRRKIPDHRIEIEINLYEEAIKDQNAALRRP